ncbi:YeiH family protein [Brevundimonas viscosa]|uniref:Conserved hypothetical integral membrane protein n=1 Tax=Brevundimonas viscosa TaxID=871741 RepID=A0A1I6NT21_9CAUL|nr:putative sulfate exporter family transporter [Brevundimonas viscosa]SFS31097.1 conserved hypothetical integral membrane protein [Brevundimonas viscosa]
MIPAPAPADRRSPAAYVLALLPGLLLCAAVTGAALGVETLELRLFGRAWLDAVVLAILIGAAIRTVWTPPEALRPGVAFSARTLLEIAVVLLGASISAATVMAIGPGLMLGVVGVVAVAIAAAYGLGRLLRLPHRMAMLIACGNGICGNSAIVAVAPVIDAEPEEVTAAIAFTAVLGIAVVLLLPLLAAALEMAELPYGVVAGLTVYAVPQVLAATMPVGALATQTGTLIKLVRVLMLGPVVLALSLAVAARAGQGGSGSTLTRLRAVPLGRLVPWFIVGFLLMMAARSLDLIPAAALPPMDQAATALTVISMAALGLGADARAVARSGPRIAVAVTLSLLVLLGLALALVSLLAVG